MKKNMAWLMTPMQAWVSRLIRPATHTSTKAEKQRELLRRVAIGMSAAATLTLIVVLVVASYNFV